LHRAWEISIDGQTLILKRYGSFCRWNKLTLEKGSEEVYRIQLKEHYGFGDKEDLGLRVEFFNDRFFRAYQGNQFSFVEYIPLMGLVNKFPSRLELTNYLERMDRKNKIPELDRLSSKTIEQTLIDSYKERAEKIISN